MQHDICDCDSYSPYSNENCICVGHQTQMKLTQTTGNVHAQHQPQCQKTQPNLYTTDFYWDFVLGETQILGLASGVTQILGFALAPRYQHVGIPNAKFWRRGHCPTPTPDAWYFASQWNKGFSPYSTEKNGTQRK